MMRGLRPLPRAFARVPHPQLTGWPGSPPGPVDRPAPDTGGAGRDAVGHRLDAMVTMLSRRF
jgi:hypothetical protein